MFTISPKNKVLTLTLILLALTGGYLGYGTSTAYAAPRLGTSPNLPLLPAPIRIEPPPQFLIGPVDGLTTAWYSTPDNIAVPVGTTIEFRVEAPDGLDISWTGAIETSRDAGGSTAQSPFHQVGAAIVNVAVSGEGLVTWSQSVSVQVISIAADQIQITGVSASVAPLGINQNSSNAETMARYFGESIADLQVYYLDDPRLQNTDPQLPVDYFATSVDRTISLTAHVSPPEFASLLEWRVENVPVALGASTAQTFHEVGLWTMSVGALANPGLADIETYRVSITGFTYRRMDAYPGADLLVPEDKLITFYAATDPPGYENEITWMASTRHGSTSAVLGSGSQFAVEFNDTFGDDPVNGYSQWLGIKADNAQFSQEQ